MSLSRRVTVGAAAAVAALAFIPTPASASPDQYLKDLVLTGECPGLKTVIVTPRTAFLFAPLRLIDGEFAPTGKWLFPVTVTVTGEGLKTRHMLPGETYTRPGRSPANQVTCVFYGATKEDGEFTVQITGPIRGR